MAPARALVADASVIVKWFVNEKFTKESLVLKKAHERLDTRIVVPSLARYEVLNALKYSGKFGSDELGRVSNDLENFQFVELPMEGAYGRSIVKMAMKYGLTIYDSAYLAIGETRSLAVYTAEDRLLEKVKELSFVHHISDYAP